MAAVIPPADPKNVQGDIVIGFSKKLEVNLFFQIDNTDGFRKQLGQLVPKITTAVQVTNDKASIKKHKQAGGKDLLKISGLNIAFSQSGLNKLGITDDIGDSLFKDGQLAHASDLGDKGATFDNKAPPTDWVQAFRDPVHGFMIVAGDCQATLDERLAEAMQILQMSSTGTCHEVLRLQGAVRPGDQKGHEHFGFLDSISNPAIKDVDTSPLPGQDTVSQGVILLGRDRDFQSFNRPDWAVDGSMLAFRYLSQLVPEFNDFLEQSANPLTGLTAEFLGARLMGRWKSGAPLDLTPLQDDPDLGKDPQRNNHFRYDFPEDSQTQDRCPFAAHIRKTNPRNDLGEPLNTELNRITRRGIAYGPELSEAEQQQKRTLQDRGLLFRCYQSNLNHGFHFIQQSWANFGNFPPGKSTEPGFDAVIGQNQLDSSSRSITGVDPKNQSTQLSLPALWVLPKGGEYFFSPSIPALKNRFALA
ncbi:hypothetical protein EIP91_004756 [Steccherinum ochraceum]|uniref:DyP dimeric alpha+beta barrel domain-containing protein n=1 Tax=Steccherinum ochraceum TaxID=92696 RepID=A0A4R0RAU3_9APHY|nr:hypothetical protein EIP91_004756 [Steccherinum ochraceum]